MLVRRLVVSLGVAVVGVALLAVPSYADAPTEVYVQTPANGGDDLNFPTCSQVLPCATVPSALNAVADGGTIHVGPGTFDGWVNLGARAIAVTISGDSAQGTILTASSTSPSGYDGTVVEAYAGVEASLSHLTVSGDGDDTGVLAYDSSQLALDDVVVDGGDCALGVFNADVDLTDSTLQHGGGATCSGGLTVTGDLGFVGGTVNLTRTRILDPAVGTPGVDMLGGTLTADQSFFDDSGHPLGTNNSTGLDMGVGTATVTRSTFHNWGTQAVDVDGGTAMLSDATFQNNSGAVFGDSGSTTVVRSTFQSNGASLLGTTVSVAGSVLASVPTGTHECNGTVTDLGYNLATDDSCAFTEATSQENVSAADLNVTDGIDDRGGPFGLPTVAILNPSVAVDTIPSGATYGSPATPLCPATGTTDLRGVPRPVGGACDAGSMEMIATTTRSPGRRRRSHIRTSRSKPRSGRPGNRRDGHTDGLGDLHVRRHRAVRGRAVGAGFPEEGPVLHRGLRCGQAHGEGHLRPFPRQHHPRQRLSRVHGAGRHQGTDQGSRQGRRTCRAHDERQAQGLGSADSRPRPVQGTPAEGPLVPQREGQGLDHRSRQEVRGGHLPPQGEGDQPDG